MPSGTPRRATITRIRRDKKSWPDWIERLPAGTETLCTGRHKAQTRAIGRCQDVSAMEGLHGPRRAWCGRHLTPLRKRFDDYEIGRALRGARESSEEKLTASVAEFKAMTGYDLDPLRLSAVGTTEARIMLTPGELDDLLGHLKSTTWGRLDAGLKQVDERTWVNRSLATRGHTDCIPKTEGQ